MEEAIPLFTRVAFDKQDGKCPRAFLISFNWELRDPQEQVIDDRVIRFAPHLAFPKKCSMQSLYVYLSIRPF